MNFNRDPSQDIFVASQQPQITPWVRGQQPPPQGSPIGAQQPQPGGGMGGMPPAGAQQQRPGMGMPQGADPAMLKAIVALNMQSAEAQDAERQKALAERLRADAKGQLAGRDTGKFYVGPSWLNLGANVLENQKAYSADRKAKEKEEKAAKDTTDVSERIVKALANNKRTDTY